MRIWKFKLKLNLPLRYLELKDAATLTKVPNGLDHYGTKPLTNLTKSDISLSRIRKLGDL